MKTIVFDLDDTLYNLMGPFELAHKDIFASKMDEDIDCEELFRLSRVYSDEAFYRADKGEISHEEEFIYRIVKCYGDMGVHPTKEEAKQFEKKYRHYQRHIQLPEGSKKILDYIKENQIKAAILTNGQKDGQQNKLDALQLERWIPKEYLFISAVVGAVKPSKEVFDRVREALKEDAKDLWYVGDAFDMDIVGAHHAGWHSIWFNHRHRQPSTDYVVPDVTVYTYEELLEYIKMIRK